MEPVAPSIQLIFCPKQLCALLCTLAIKIKFSFSVPSPLKFKQLALACNASPYRPNLYSPLSLSGPAQNSNLIAPHHGPLLTRQWLLRRFLVVRAEQQHTSSGASMAVHGGHRMVTVPPSGSSDGQEELESDLQSQLSSLQSRVEVSGIISIQKISLLHFEL